MVSTRGNTKRTTDAEDSHQKRTKVGSSAADSKSKAKKNDSVPRRTSPRLNNRGTGVTSSDVKPSSSTKQSADVKTSVKPKAARVKKVTKPKVQKAAAPAPAPTVIAPITPPSPVAAPVAAAALPKQPRAKKLKMIRKGRAAVDPVCYLASQSHVYEDKDGTIWNCTLNQTDIAANHNKFYIIQLLQSDSGNDFFVWTHWGRVGGTGQNNVEHSMGLDAAKRFFEAKYRTKTKNSWETDPAAFVRKPQAYFPLEIDYGDEKGDEDDDEEEKVRKEQVKKDFSRRVEEGEAKIPDSTLDPRVQDVISRIFDVGMINQTMAELEIDAEKLPLGKLKKETILQAFDVLTQIEKCLMTSPGNRSTLMELSSFFYTLIPTVSPSLMQRLPVIDNIDALKTKVRLLETLGEIEISSNLLKIDPKTEMQENQLDVYYRSLKCDIAPVDKKSELFSLVQNFVRNTHAATHSWYTLDVEDVFMLNRAGEKEKFTENYENHRLLFHGSRLANFAGILSQGLRIAPPEAPCTGYMFGKGVYFADACSKAANYIHASQGNDVGFALLCDVALGDMYERTSAEYITKLPGDKKSTWGKGRYAPDEGSDLYLSRDELEKMDARSVTKGLESTKIRVPTGNLATQSSISNSSLLYNEFIVYDPKQIRASLLLKLKFNFKRGGIYD